MTENICTCGETTRDHAYVGDDCADKLAKALGDIPDLEDELEITMSRQKGVDYSQVGGTSVKSPEMPLPIHLGAVEARTHLRALLWSWALFCTTTGVRNSSPDGDALPGGSLYSMSTWLQWRVDGLTLVEKGPDAVSTIVEAVERCRRVIDRPAERLYAGRCGGTDGECPEDLYAAKDSRGVECTGCGTMWDVSERRTWLLAEAEEVLGTATELARAVSWLGSAPLTAERVRQWAKRGRIEVKGHDRKGDPTYRVGDAIDLMSELRKGA